MTASTDRSAHSGLEEHVAECAECRAAPPPLAHIVALLNSSAVPLDVPELSQRTFLRLQPEVARLAMRGLRRQVAVAVLLALLPLPAVLAYDAYLLRLAYELVSVLVPATLAAYLIFGHAAFLVLLFGTTYAAIPLFLAHQSAGERPALG